MNSRSALFPQDRLLSCKSFLKEILQDSVSNINSHTEILQEYITFAESNELTTLYANLASKALLLADDTELLSSGQKYYSAIQKQHELNKLLN